MDRTSVGAVLGALITVLLLLLLLLRLLIRPLARLLLLLLLLLLRGGRTRRTRLLLLLSGRRIDQRLQPIDDPLLKSLGAESGRLSLTEEFGRDEHVLDCGPERLRRFLFGQRRVESRSIALGDRGIIGGALGIRLGFEIEKVVE